MLLAPIMALTEGMEVTWTWEFTAALAYLVIGSLIAASPSSRGNVGPSEVMVLSEVEISRLIMAIGGLSS